MDKLKKFKKFEISAEKAEKVKGGLTCYVKSGKGYAHMIFANTEVGNNEAVNFCAGMDGCAGCF